MTPIAGVAVGIIANATDPAGRGRVQVRVPSVRDAAEMWAPTVRPPGRRDASSRYQQGDRVLVAFEHGDPARPYVLGLLWSSKDAPPEPSS